MKINNTAFTLIELLAVIVILAIIALISTPIIIGIIDDTRKESFKASSYGMISSAEQGFARTLLSSDGATVTEFQYNEGTQTKIQGNVDLTYNGKSPNYGTILINGEGQVAVALYEDGYCAVKSYNESEITLMKVSQEECKVLEYTTFDKSKGVNIPQLASGMTPIVWNATTGEWDEVDKRDPNWYDYSTQKWANAKTVDGSFWVWIPRYAYKITGNHHSSTTGTIDIKFLRDSTTIALDDTVIEKNDYNVTSKNASENYFLHPAFSDDSELGFWVAKFEPSVADQTNTCYISSTNCNLSNLTLAVIPNAKSWRNIDVKNAYQTSVAMKDKKTIYGWDTTEVDTHMMKNTEWGAVAYLSQSSYGKYGSTTYTDAIGLEKEIWINPNSNFITGCAGDSVSSGAITTCNQYYTANGVKASTTGNIYGIYDMNGGTWERVMAVYNNLSDSSGFTTEELTAIPSKHINRYTTETENMLSGSGMNYDNTFYGDAIYETSNNAYRYNGSTWVGVAVGAWYGDTSYLPYVSNSWFSRGGLCNRGSASGSFSFISTSGNAIVNSSFRPVVSILN